MSTDAIAGGIGIEAAPGAPCCPAPIEVAELAGTEPTVLPHAATS